MGQSPTHTTFDPFAPDPWNVLGPMPMRPLSESERSAFAEASAIATDILADFIRSQELPAEPKTTRELLSGLDIRPETIAEFERASERAAIAELERELREAPGVTGARLDDAIEEIRRLSDRISELENRLSLVIDHGLAAGEKLTELQTAFVALRRSMGGRS